ncbi:active regulator of SIRT1 isoform X2 [Choloepus didactylus]|uniref:active regulator of SIRT1 isoform X2 n=1 Tax=Choloepus didactylus TaxID=27675 RepID=UPI0018A09846|nr:active regulator of SIRT1 isoform X2 [Choloepus didactylus]
MSAALLRRGLELLGASEAPQAASGDAKRSGTPVKRTRKAKATQARKLRNSAKGKVPKSALAEFRKRECRDYLRANLKFMTSARRTVAESVTHQDPVMHSTTSRWQSRARMAQGSPGPESDGGWNGAGRITGLFAVEHCQLLGSHTSGIWRTASGQALHLH